MKSTGLVIADTSVWIDFFRSGQSAQSAKLARHLERDRVCLVPVIWAEILSGSKTLAEFNKLKRNLSALPILEEFPGFWEEVAQARFRLARKGVQAAIPDLMIAASASHYGCRLITLDKEFHTLATVMPVRLEL